MRKYVRSGGVNSRIQYKQLREKVWEEVFRLDRDLHIFHDNDIQEIAMIKAKELGLHEFLVIK